MTRFIPPAIIAITSAGTDAGVRYIEGQPVGLATAMTVAACVGTLAIWLEHRLTRIETRINNLPCENNGCSLKRKRKSKT